MARDSATPNGLGTTVERLLDDMERIQAVMVDMVDTKRRRIATAELTVEQTDAWQDSKYHEYDGLYLEIASSIESLVKAGLRITNPNRYRTLWDWASAYHIPNSVCGQMAVQYWLRDVLYLPLSDGLRKARSQYNRLGGADADVLAALKDQFGQESRYAFDRLHPIIKVRCEELFSAGNLDEAVFSAMKVVENELRERTGASAESVGVSLVSQALAPQNARLLLSEVTAEQEGAHFLYRGAIGFFKNPVSHRFVGNSDADQAFEAVTLASLLMRLLDDAKPSADRSCSQPT